MITRIGVIDGLEHTFIKPIINQVRNDINRAIIKDRDPDIYFYNIGNYENENVNIDDNVTDNTISGPMLYYKYATKDNEELALATSTYKPLNKILLLDSSNGFMLRPNFKTIDIEITFTYKTRSKTNCHRVINRLKTYYDTSGYTMVHNLPYSYLIPNNVLNLIDDIRKCKDDSVLLKDYINSISKYKFDYTVRHDGRGSVPVFNGIYSNIFGMFDTNPNDIEIDKGDNEYYSVEFVYSFSVKEPISLTVQYPILVNNVSLPDIWLPPKEVVKPVSNAESEISISDIIGNYNRFNDNNLAMVHIPSYDNFYPIQYDDRSMIRLVCIQLDVDKNNSNLIFNVSDLKYVGIPDPLITLLKGCDEDEVFTFTRSLLYIELYEGNTKKNNGLYKDDENNIHVQKPLDHSKSYHLVINAVIDRNYISYVPTEVTVSDKNIRDNKFIETYRIPMMDLDGSILHTAH